MSNFECGGKNCLQQFFGYSCKCLLSEDCCTQVSDAAKVRLSGYGVELAIKSTEYKAKDDTVITGNMLSLVLGRQV